jgi:hypothetical protein
MAPATAHPYFKAIALLAMLGAILAVVSFIVVMVHAPMYHPLLKLAAIAVFELIILVLAFNHKVSAFVLAFLLNLYEIIYAYHIGSVYDIFNFHASVLTYANFALVLLSLIVSGLGLFICFKIIKLQKFKEHHVRHHCHHPHQ